VIGNLTNDPVLRATREGRAVANFTVATDETRRRREGEGYETFAEYHQCVAGGAQAERVGGRLRKGDLVSVSGPLRTRTKKTETTTYYNTTVEVDAVRLEASDRAVVSSFSACVGS
jgi:single-strand DNA-binding protein